MLGASRPTPVWGSPDERIREVADRQRGHITRRQLLAIGVDSNAIDRRIGSGNLRRQHPGVYSVGHRGDRALHREVAALLALRPGSVLSHVSAAVLWGLRAEDDGLVHAIVPGTSAGPRLHGVRVHRTTTLTPRDVRLRRDLPVTAPALALLHIAPALAARDLERAVDEALVRRLTTRSELRELSAAARPGAPQLRALVDDDGATTLTRSEAEERFLALVRAAGLPEPRVNVRLHGFEVDFAWPESRLCVEIDGFAFHSTRRAFEADRRRDAVLRAAGMTVLRFSRRQLVAEPFVVVADLARSLSAATSR
ncbi:MAG: DUF559 domain-containing protein [Solirubrobacterales bacterium]|nr:DUF559 domain-containing protein [Solirubrobacterales bacterium]